MKAAPDYLIRSFTAHGGESAFYVPGEPILLGRTATKCYAFLIKTLDVDTTSVVPRKQQIHQFEQAEHTLTAQEEAILAKYSLMAKTGYVINKRYAEKAKWLDINGKVIKTL